MRRHCNLSGRCGGCTYANIPYADELLDKRVMEEKLLGRFSDVAPILQSGRITGYRCKVQAVCGMDDGRTIYEGSIYYDGYEYEFEIDGHSGRFLDFERERERWDW